LLSALWFQFLNVEHKLNWLFAEMLIHFLTLNIFDQNIRWQRNKSDEVIQSSEIDGINTCILCLSKHHMVEQDLLHLTLDGYLLSSSFCANKLQRGGLCIFIEKDECFNKIDISHH
jgi:phosphate uptake regulator